jgi:Uma2 family endonuclease
MVVCGEPVYGEGHRDILTNPSVVVEVLSESTEKWDRGGKFAQYRRVASLREYVLVSQDAMRVEWFTREGDGAWTYREAVGPEGVVRLEGLGVSVGLGRVYRKVAGFTE